jgi:hypothetical protein
MMRKPNIDTKWLSNVLLNIRMQGGMPAKTMGPVETPPVGTLALRYIP